MGRISEWFERLQRRRAINRARADVQKWEWELTYGNLPDYGAGMQSLRDARKRLHTLLLADEEKRWA